MLEIRELLVDSSSAPSARLTLPFDARQKSRLRARLDDGREVGLFLARGTVLRGGDVLRASDDTLIEVVSANETLSSVASADARALTRVAYHLGNRHVPVEIGEGVLRYQHDHVLDDMVRQLGLEVRIEEAGFEPERGAYAHGHAHSHSESHSHAHDRGHSHGHGRLHEDEGVYVHEDEHVHDHEDVHEHEHEHDGAVERV